MKQSKYKAVKTYVDDICFDSAKEARRYSELKLLEKGKVINSLELQPEFPVMIEGKKICKYRADFAYYEDDRRVIEDVKGFKTPIYRLKKKLVEALYGVEIIET